MNRHNQSISFLSGPLHAGLWSRTLILWILRVKVKDQQWSRLQFPEHSVVTPPVPPGSHKCNVCAVVISIVLLDACAHL